MRYRGAILGYMESMPDDYAPYMEDGTFLIAVLCFKLCLCVRVSLCIKSDQVGVRRVPPSLPPSMEYGSRASDAGPPLTNQPINA